MAYLILLYCSLYFKLCVIPSARSTYITWGFLFNFQVNFHTICFIFSLSQFFLWFDSAGLYFKYKLSSQTNWNRIMSVSWAFSSTLGPIKRYPPATDMIFFSNWKTHILKRHLQNEYSESKWVSSLHSSFTSGHVDSIREMCKNCTHIVYSTYILYCTVQYTCTMYIVSENRSM